MKPNYYPKPTQRWRFMLSLLFTLLVISYLISTFLGLGLNQEFIGGNVAVIPIHGFIGFSGPFYSELVNPDETIELIKRASESPNIKAIVFDINSGGGTPVASEAIANAIKGLNKTSVALIRDIGTSGAYWVASACDVVFASKYSITGSIGVLGSYLDYYGLMQRYNVSYERLVGGDYKDIGTKYKPLTPQERAILQSKIDKMHDSFVSEISTNRGLTQAQRAQIATGLFFTGEEGIDVGLVDMLGGYDEVENYLKSVLNITKVKMVRVTPKRTFFENLASLFSQGMFKLGMGLGLTLEHQSYTQDIQDIEIRAI